MGIFEVKQGGVATLGFRVATPLHVSMGESALCQNLRRTKKDKRTPYYDMKNPFQLGIKEQ